MRLKNCEDYKAFQNLIFERLIKYAERQNIPLTNNLKYNINIIFKNYSHCYFVDLQKLVLRNYKKSFLDKC